MGNTKQGGEGSGALRALIIPIVSLLVSILAGFIPDWTGSPFSTADQVLFTTVLFGVFVLLDVLVTITKLSGARSREERLWTIRDSGEGELATIRARFDQIAKEASGPHDLFVTHFTKEFHRLNSTIRDAAEKRELRVVSDYYLNDDTVFETFLADQDKPRLRYTWPIVDGEKLFGEHAWRRYFEVVADMANRNRITSIQALLIVDGSSSVGLPKLQLLLDYFRMAERQECRIISKDTYRKIAGETGIPTNYLDFGIYSERMLFRSENYFPEYVGVFTKDRPLIQQYTRFFDTLWDSMGVVRKNPSTKAEVVTLEHLIETDLA